MKNVRTRLLILICGVVSVSLLALGIVSGLLNFQTTSGVLEQTMRETAKIAAERVSCQLNIHKTVVGNVGVNAVICNPYATLEQKQKVLDDIVAEYPDFTRGNILGTDGISIFNDTGYSDRDYFQNAMKGNTWVSEPLLSRVTGAVTIIVSAPIWQDGIANTTVIGVVYFVPAETFLNDIVADIKISNGAGAQIINKSGTIVAHPDMDRVASYSNSQELEKTDAAYTEIAALERKAMQGQIGFGSYTMVGVDKFLAFAPIPDSDGWSIGVNAPISDFMSYTNTSIIYTGIFLAFFLTIAVILAVNTAGKIGKPLNCLAEILSDIAKTGTVELSNLHQKKLRGMQTFRDEISLIAEATDNLIVMLSRNAAVLDAIADGDLTIAVQPLSKNDKLGNAMFKMTSGLNRMLAEMNQSSLQVSDGARQIAAGSQTLALGSTEQAAAVEQFSGSINRIAEKTRANAEMAEKAAALTNTVRENAEKGNHQMGEMMAAVKEINEASHRINNVIKVIDDIAFQTNILALNAAVEAARAGQHGKGFAVVAEEVRSLAIKSAVAAKDTGSLIANSIAKAELGAHIAKETASSLHEIVSGIGESTHLVMEIAESSEEQSAGIEQVNKGIDQVARVVQQNSATAQESAAASQEMSSQSDILQSLVARFKIKEENNRERLPSLSPATYFSNIE